MRVPPEASTRNFQAMIALDPTEPTKKASAAGSLEARDAPRFEPRFGAFGTSYIVVARTDQAKQALASLRHLNYAAEVSGEFTQLYTNNVVYADRIQLGRVQYGGPGAIAQQLKTDRFE